jgi:Chaperone of endosialidase
MVLLVVLTVSLMASGSATAQCWQRTGSFTYLTNSDDDVGIGTDSPGQKLHMVTGNSPAIRLEQDNSSGWTPQTWDIAGNESNFFIRDVTNSSRLPFRIEPATPSSTLCLKDTGYVGMGTFDPDYALEVETTGEDAAIYLDRTDGVECKFNASTDYGQIGTATEYDFNIITNSYRRMTVDYNGYVGIGTTDPATILDVDGVVTATGGTSTNWNTAYSQRRQWNGSSTNLNAAIGRTSLGLGSVQNIDVQSFWSQSAGQYIGSDEVRARDGSGLKLYDDGGNGLFVEDGGQVGIGLIDPSRALHLQGHNAVFRMDRDVNTSGFLFVRTAPGDFNTIWKTYHVGGRASGVDTGEFIIDDLGTSVSGDGTRLLTISNSGDWAIGTQSPIEKLDVQGNVIADDYLYNSSRELKCEITPLSPEECARMLDKVEAIEVCRYRMKSGGEDGPVKLGMIAEDAPREIQSTNGKSIRMTDTVGLLLAGMKAQSEEIKRLKLRIDRLEKR